MTEELLLDFKEILKSYNNNIEDKFNAFFSLLRKHNDSNNIIRVMDFFLKYSMEKSNCYEKYDIDKTYRFNFFESISDKWYRENFHSDILYTLLNPKTKEIGRKLFIQEFIKFLDLNKEQFDCDVDFEIIKEAPTGIIKWNDNNGNEREKKGFIDLLIRNKKQAIIIENKINYAPDMENQLVRYMKYVEEVLHIHNYTVVYLTLINDKNKRPPINSYDECFKKYTDKLRNGKVLKEIYAVNNEKSIAKTFLTKCQNELTKSKKQNSNIAYVYVEQYKVLLNHLGGYAYMSTIDKKILEKIYSDEELFDLITDFNIIWNNKESPIRKSDEQLITQIRSNKAYEKAANDFMDLWNNRWEEPVKEILLDRFHKTFPSRSTILQKINGYEEYFWKHYSNEFNIYWNGAFQIGYTTLEGKSFTKKQQNELVQMLVEILQISEDCISQNNHWIYYDIPNDLFSSLNNVIDYLRKIFKKKKKT